MQSIQNIYLSAIIHALHKHPVLKASANPLLHLWDKTLSFDEAEAIAKGDLEKHVHDNVQSIFVGLGKAQNPKQYYNLQSLNISKDNFFPKTNAHKNQGAIVLELTSDIQKLVRVGFETGVLAENLLHLLEKHTVNVPCGFGASVSFYDFVKLKSAVAICFAANVAKKYTTFSLISGGISGVQSYLYDIVSKKASLNLKARSLYLQLLPELVLNRILKDLGLYEANVLYASGGNFYILAPKVDDEQVQNWRNAISQALFEAHGTALYLELDATDALPDEFKYKTNFIFKALNDKLSAQKRHKFSYLIAHQPDFFEPVEVGGEQVRDALTNEVLAKGDLILDLELRNPVVYEDAKSQEVIGALTNFLMDSGEALEDNHWLTIRQAEANAIEPFKTIGFTFKIVSNPEASENPFCKVYYLEDLNYLSKIHRFASLSYGFRFYGGDDYPKIKIKTGNHSRAVAKTFSELGGMAENDKKRLYVQEFSEPRFKRLGILRMDVDGLGNIFINGFASLAPYMVLSRSLDYFFKGYLNELWRNDFKNDVQIVYSGGDDLFVVGKWDKVIEFAEKIRTEFKAWVCQNDCLSISGGIAFVTPKFPIIKAAKYSGDAEDEAKKHEFNGKLKNAISMLGVTMNWDNEYKAVGLLKNKILSLAADKKQGLATSFIYKISGFYEKTEPKKFINKADYDVKKKEIAPTWRWQMAYDMKRMSERYKANRDDKNEKVQFLEEMMNWAILPNEIPILCKSLNVHKDTFFKLLNLACIWASYELRNQEK
ncbi:MAG: type CRISPR-associated protein Cas10/Csm1 [Bacteroidota bacterium]|jgi:CRISPR-associated protein Csm1